MSAPVPSRKQRLITNLQLQLYGWLLFIACALLFTLHSLLSRDPLLLAASWVFR